MLRVCVKVGTELHHHIQIREELVRGNGELVVGGANKRQLTLEEGVQ